MGRPNILIIANRRSGTGSGVDLEAIATRVLPHAAAQFTIVYTGRMIATDPLAPTMQPELSPIFMTGKVRIADKPEMGLETGLGKGFAQASNTACNATRLGITVRAFKAEDVKLRVDRGTLNCRRPLHIRPRIVYWFQSFQN